MLLVFIYLSLSFFIVFVFILLGLLFSKIEVDFILNHNLDLKNKNFHKINFNIYLYKLKFLKINTKYLKLIKIYSKGKDLKSFKLKDLELLNIKISNIYFKSKIYTKNYFLTIHLVSLFSIIISALYGFISFRNKMGKAYFDIKPVFNTSFNEEKGKKINLIKCQFLFKVKFDFSALCLIYFILYTNKRKKGMNKKIKKEENKISKA